MTAEEGMGKHQMTRLPSTRLPPPRPCAGSAAMEPAMWPRSGTPWVARACCALAATGPSAPGPVRVGFSVLPCACRALAAPGPPPPPAWHATPGAEPGSESGSRAPGSELGFWAPGAARPSAASRRHSTAVSSASVPAHSRAQRETAAASASCTSRGAPHSTWRQGRQGPSGSGGV